MLVLARNRFHVIDVTSRKGPEDVNGGGRVLAQHLIYIISSYDSSRERGNHHFNRHPSGTFGVDGWDLTHLLDLKSAFLRKDYVVFWMRGSFLRSGGIEKFSVLDEKSWS